MSEWLDETLLAEVHSARELTTRKRFVAACTVMFVPGRMLVGNVIRVRIDVDTVVVVIVRCEHPTVFGAIALASIDAHCVDESAE